MDRRNFLKISTTTTGGLLISAVLPHSILANEKNGSLNPNVLTEIHRDGSVTFTLTRHEMGQGTGTGVPMIFCEELGADWDTFKIICADHDSKKYQRLQGTTGGSNGLSGMWQPMRQMGAAAREVLIQAAAKKWNSSTTGLYTDKGFVFSASGDRVKFGELIDLASEITSPALDKVALKANSDFTIIGKPIKNRITPKIVKGEKYFALDLKVPGMLYASIERCPVYRGTLVSFDDSEVRKLDGVVDIIKVPEIYEDDNFIVREGVAVIATSTWIAMQGRKALKIDWNDGVNASMNNESLRKNMEELSSKPGTKAHDYYGNFGNPDSAFGEADEVLNVTYENAYHAHACMEPMNAIADIKNGKCELWAPTQNPNSASKKIELYAGVPEKDQTIHILPSGGSFGRKFYPEHITEAAYLSKQLQNPIKLTWTREDDIRCDYNSAFQHDNHKIGIKEGKVTGWNINVVSTKSWSPEPWFPYIVPNKKGESHIIDTPLSTGAWRSVGPHRAAFATEGMIDELAHKFDKDPLAYRLELLEERTDLPEDAIKYYNQPYSQDALKKTRHVLELVAEKGEWGKKMPRNSGQGIAVYRFSRSFCAHLVEASVTNGQVKVDKVTAAIYCGTAVNPHLVKGQVEGAIIWAMTSVLYGGMDFEKGRVKQSNFHDYKMVRMDETPEMDIHIVPSEDSAVGVGEPGVPPFTPALMNAIFAATGKRIRRTPLKADDLI